MRGPNARMKGDAGRNQEKRNQRGEEVRGVDARRRGEVQHDSFGRSPKTRVDKRGMCSESHGKVERKRSKQSMTYAKAKDAFI